MEIKLKRVCTTRDLWRFIRFPYTLYKANRYWCPPIRLDEFRTLHWKKNPAFDFCSAAYWIAEQDNRVVGRIAAIINPRANERWDQQLVRFGWFDFVDNPTVSSALLEEAATWGKEHGMEGMHGPLGFTDIDNEGMLTEGFDAFSSLPTLYNAPYYVEHMMSFGYEKSAEWIQMEFDIPPVIPDKVLRTASLVEERYGLRTLKVKRKQELLPYARKMLKMLDVAYHNLYAYAPLTDAQIENYINQFFGFINKEFVSLVIDREDQVVGFGVSMPSFTRALQRCNGKLFPFGFIYLLQAMRKNDIIDLYLLGTHPMYQGKGVTALFFRDLHEAYIRHGMKRAIAADQLVNNTMALSIWKNYPGRIIKRRCCWIRKF